jgi:tetratricopeptide (TPR) repeat protein
MPYKYTWSATDQYGQKVIKEVEAPSALEAQSSLRAAGYSNLELKEDEIMTTARAGFSKTLRATTKQRVAKLENPSGTTWEILKPRLNEGKIIFLLLILVSSFLFYRRDFRVGGLITFALVVLLGSQVLTCLPLIYYRKLVKAADWYRWRQVLFLIGILKTIGKISIIKIPDTGLTRYRAKALAGLGNMQEALDEFKQCEGRPDCPGWLYKLFVAGLYTTAKQYDKAIENNLAAIAENPNPTASLDLANRYARYKRDPVKARESLAEADKSPLTNVAKRFRTRCLGVIAYLEGDYVTAKTELESYISSLENIKYLPFKDGHLAIARAYLCCVLAKQGDLPAAKKNLDLAREYLIATDEDELLAECRRLIGEDGR